MSLWFKHDAHFHEHPKCLRLRRLAGSRADAAEVGWWRIVAAAKRLNDWTFEDDEHLLDAAGKYGSFIPLYRQVGLLDDLTIHNAEEYQGPKSDAERQAKSRSVRDTSHAPSVTTVTPREEKSREEQRENIARDGLPHITPEAQRLIEGLTGKLITTAGDKQLTEYDRQLEAHGLGAVERAYRAVAGSVKNPTYRQLVWSALRVLEPFTTPQDIAKVEAASSSRAAVDRTQRMLRELRGETA